MSMLQCDLARNLHKRSSYMYKERAGKGRNGKARVGAGMRLFLFHIGTTAQGRTDVIVSGSIFN